MTTERPSTGRKTKKKARQPRSRHSRLGRPQARPTSDLHRIGSTKTTRRFRPRVALMNPGRPMVRTQKRSGSATPPRAPRRRASAARWGAVRKRIPRQLRPTKRGLPNAPDLFLSDGSSVMSGRLSGVSFAADGKSSALDPGLRKRLDDAVGCRLGNLDERESISDLDRAD